MTGTELVNIIKSPTSKIVMFGTLLITGALILVPILNRNEDPNSIVQETELRQEEKAPLDIGSDIPRFKLDRDSDSGAAAETPPPVIGDSRSSKPALPKGSGNTARENTRQKLAERSERIPRERDLASMLGIKKDSQANARGNSFQSRIFVLSAAQGTKSEAKRS